MQSNLPEVPNFGVRSDEITKSLNKKGKAWILDIALLTAD